MRWVIVVALVLLALLLATRRVNGITRMAAAGELGRRHPYLVHAWPVLRWLVAAGVVAVAVAVAADTGAPPPAATGPVAAPATEQGGGVPWLAVLAVAGLALVAAAGVAVVRGRRNDQLDAFLFEDDDEPLPPPAPRREEHPTEDLSGQAGTGSTAPIDATEDEDDEHDADDRRWPAAEDADAEAGDGGPGGTVHRLPARRRGARRPL
jgi:hypothetical protein